MSNSKSNYTIMVRGRKVIPSANPTMSRTSNPTKVMRWPWIDVWPTFQGHRSPKVGQAVFSKACGRFGRAESQKTLFRAGRIRLGTKHMGGVFYPQFAQITPRHLSISMLNSKSNYVRTVRDRKAIPSANPTKSRTANPTVVMSLTLD